MEGIKAKDQTDFSKMTDNEVFWYLRGKKMGRQELLEEQEESDILNTDASLGGQYWRGQL